MERACPHCWDERVIESDVRGLPSAVAMSRRDDPVNHPAHYAGGEVECIDAMRACATREEFRGFLRLNALKYIWRAGRKGPAGEDVRKGMWYLGRLAGEFAGEEGNE